MCSHSEYKCSYIINIQRFFVFDCSAFLFSLSFSSLYILWNCSILSFSICLCTLHALSRFPIKVNVDFMHLAWTHSNRSFVRLWFQKTISTEYLHSWWVVIWWIRHGFFPIWFFFWILFSLLCCKKHFSFVKLFFIALYGENLLGYSCAEALLLSNMLEMHHKKLYLLWKEYQLHTISASESKQCIFLCETWQFCIHTVYFSICIRICIVCAFIFCFQFSILSGKSTSFSATRWIDWHYCFPC